MKTALELLEEATQTYRERNKAYGDSYIKHGKIMEILFPDGITIKGETDFGRFSIFNIMIAKICRYSNQTEWGHQDSIRDIGVYAFVLEELDGRKLAREGVKWTATVDFKVRNPDGSVMNGCQHIYDKKVPGVCITCGEKQ